MACIIIVLHMVIVISHKHKPFSKITVINILFQSQIMFAPHFPFPYFTHICKQHWNWQFSQTFYYLTFCLHTSPYSPNSPSFPIFLQHTHTHTHTPWKMIVTTPSESCLSPSSTKTFPFSYLLAWRILPEWSFQLSPLKPSRGDLDPGSETGGHSCSRPFPPRYPWRWLC